MRIGSGNSVDIFGDPWLPTCSNAYVTITHPGLTNSKVQSLMQIGRREWDVEVVQDSFNVRGCNIILVIPLSVVVDMDRYKFLLQQKISLNLHGDSRVWSHLWRMKISHKVQYFV